jgi:hypothetical protein
MMSMQSTVIDAERKCSMYETPTGAQCRQYTTMKLLGSVNGALKESDLLSYNRGFRETLRLFEDRRIAEALLLRARSRFFLTLLFFLCVCACPLFRLAKCGFLYFSH